MRILAISAYYPPYHSGGYELRCKNIMDALADRGHAVLALTSQSGAGSQSPSPDAAYVVSRRLHLSDVGGVVSRMTERGWSHDLGMLLGFVRELWFGWRDTAFVDAQIRRFQPDVIYLGHVTNFSKTLVPYLANMPLVYDEGGSGLIHLWTERGIWYKFTDEYVSGHFVFNVLKSLVVKVVGSMSGYRIKPRWAWPGKMRIVFNGGLGLRKAMAQGIPVNGAKVIHSGVDTREFSFTPRGRFGSPLQFILPGGIVPRKGQIDGVKLLAELRERGIDGSMIIVGKTWSDSYYRELTDEIKRLQLENRVQLMPMITQAELAGLYHKADICFFPSYQTAGFSRVPLEAMACGCIVISYGNEGSDEIIRDRHSGFLVPPADYDSVVDVVKKLVSKPDSIRDITAAARMEVESRFPMQGYVDEIEEFLMNAADAGRRRSRPLRPTR
jgi:glycogen(starch) synthase